MSGQITPRSRPPGSGWGEGRQREEERACVANVTRRKMLSEVEHEGLVRGPVATKSAAIARTILPAYFKDTAEGQHRDANRSGHCFVFQRKIR